MTDPLAQPLTLPSGITLPNRLAKSAMSEQMGDRHHTPTSNLATLYGRWSDGGAGLLITGNVMIDHRALGEPGNVVLEQACPLAAFSRWAEAGTRQGNQLWMQLNHPGRQSPRFLSPQPVAPSAIPLHLTPGLFAPPRALPESEIEDLIARFSLGARLAKQAGFTGVQVHGAHGYLVSQFLSPLANLRTDDWGGTPEKRRRFLLEVVRGIRGEVGPAFPIGVKLNSADFQKGGFSEEEAVEVARALEAERIDLLEISGGNYERPVMVTTHSSREAYFLAFARKVRQEVRMPLMLTGGFRHGDAMRDALQAGIIDVVGLARPLTVEPDLPLRLLRDPHASCTTPLKPTGITSIDVLLNTQWYRYQLNRMGKNLAPRPDLSPWSGLLWTLLTYGWSALRRVRA